jgi:hypothetical protein
MNLNLVEWDAEPATRMHLQKIAARVMEIEPTIRVRVVPHHKKSQLALLPQWVQPTLSLSLYHVPKRKWLPGRFVTGLRLLKQEEYARLDAAGIPVPKWCVIVPSTRLDPDEWGPYVIEKPAAGATGAEVRVRKTERVRYQRQEEYPLEHPGRYGPMLAQRFVYTGIWPESYRVTTLFGEAISCRWQCTPNKGKPLPGRWAFREAGGASIVSNTKDMTVKLVRDNEVIALAERTHRLAFPQCPTLGHDIVRDAETGALFVLETQPQGSWEFTSPTGQLIQAANGFDYETFFDLTENSARIIARRVPQLAAIAPPFAPRAAPRG